MTARSLSPPVKSEIKLQFTERGDFVFAVVTMPNHSPLDMACIRTTLIQDPETLELWRDMIKACIAAQLGEAFGRGSIAWFAKDDSEAQS